MKTKILLSVLLSFYFFLLSSQIPQGFNYQAIARDSKGNPITNSTIKIKLSILTDTSGFYATGGGTYVWEEEQTNVKTNAFGLITVVFGDPSATKVQGSASSFSAIDWAKTPLFTGTKIANPTDYKNLGNAKLWSVPFSMVADSTKALLKGSRLSVVSSNDVSTDALFEVKRKDGQTVFAVYPNAVNVYVPRTTPKGVKGGFAIGGFDGNKITPQDYLRVTPDSVRIYIDKTPNLLKGATKGGFAIGGFDQTKNTTPQDLLTVSNDSIRMYINDILTKGATKGGFAIGGFDQVKGGKASFLDVATNSAGIINPSQNRILWYPIKNAFLAGRVLIEKPDSVGENSFATGYESKAVGLYSQALGYKSIARGNYSTAIGKNSIANSINSFALGDGSKSLKNDSYAFGAGAIARGLGSYAFGSAGRDTLGNLTGYMTTASGDYSFAIGQGSNASGLGAFALGANNMASNYMSTAFGLLTKSEGVASTSFGFETEASGGASVAFGYHTVASNWTDMAIGHTNKATGGCSFAMGLTSFANGWNSLAVGCGTIANSLNAFVLGRFNDTTNMTHPVEIFPTDPFFVIGNGTSNTDRKNIFTVLQNGNVGIDITNPQQKLDIARGNGRVQTGYNWLTDSDVRFKKNIFTLEGCLGKVMAIRGVSFDLISDSLSFRADRKNIGFIAQELENVVPEVVVTGSDGYKSVAYDKITAVLTEAIKEQQKQIEVQQKQIESTKQENRQLKSELDELKALVNTIVANQAGQAIN